MENVLTMDRAKTHWLRRGALVVLGFIVSFGIRRLVVGASIAVAGTIATLTLTGTVPLVLEISVAPTAAASNLDLTVDLPRTKVADLTVETNSPSGYEVTVRSDNTFGGTCASPCFYSASTSESLPFLVYRGTTQVGFAGPSARFVQVFTKSGSGGDPYDVGVSYAGSSANLSPANNYGEVLTFTVAVN